MPLLLLPAASVASLLEIGDQRLPTAVLASAPAVELVLPIVTLSVWNALSGKTGEAPLLLLRLLAVLPPVCAAVALLLLPTTAGGTDRSIGQEAGPPRSRIISTVTLSMLFKLLTACVAILCAICDNFSVTAWALIVSTSFESSECNANIDTH